MVKTKNNPMKNPIIAKKNALKRTGVKRTKKQKENISIGTKRALNKSEIKKKMRKPKTDNHKKKLKIASIGNQSAKGAKRSKEFKENCRKNMKVVSRERWQNPEYREKRLNALHKHHIDLDGNDERVLMLTSSKHLQLHSRAYDYLVKIGKIDDYIKWFDNKYSLKEE